MTKPTIFDLDRTKPDPRVTVHGPVAPGGPDWSDPRWLAVEWNLRPDYGAHLWWQIRRVVQEAVDAGLVTWTEGEPTP